MNEWIDELNDLVEAGEPAVLVTVPGFAVRRRARSEPK